MNSSEKSIFDIESFLPPEEGHLLAVALKLDDYIRFSLDKSLWDFLYVDDAETMRISNHQTLFDVEDVSEVNEKERMQQWKQDDPNTEVWIQGGLVFRRGEPFKALSYSYPMLALAWSARDEYQRIQSEREHLDQSLPIPIANKPVTNKPGPRI